MPKQLATDCNGDAIYEGDTVVADDGTEFVAQGSSKIHGSDPEHAYPAHRLAVKRDEPTPLNATGEDNIVWGS